MEGEAVETDGDQVEPVSVLVTRHPGHFDAALLDDLDDLDDVIATAEPLAITPVVRVRTDVEVDIVDVVRRIRESLPGEVGRAPTDWPHALSGHRSHRIHRRTTRP